MTREERCRLASGGLAVVMVSTVPYRRTRTAAVVVDGRQSVDGYSTKTTYAILAQGPVLQFRSSGVFKIHYRYR